MQGVSVACTMVLALLVMCMGPHMRSAAVQVSGHKNTFAKGESAGFVVESTTPPLTAIIHHVAAPAMAGNTAVTVPAVGGDIISDVAPMPYLAPLPAVKTWDTNLHIELPAKCPVAPANVPRVSGDVISDMTLMPAPLREVRPAATGDASAHILAAAVVPSCHVELGDAALMMIAAQLAAVPSEAAFKSIIAAAQHKRQAALSPVRPKVIAHGLCLRLRINIFLIQQPCAQQ